MKDKMLRLLAREDVKKLIRNVLNSKKYNNISIPLALDTNYFIDDNYALLLVLDALIKYEIIIDDEKYLSNYIDGIDNVVRKSKDYDSSIKGINKLLGKYVSRLLGLNRERSFESKEKILRYIYNKYIVSGYFYYGYSEYHKNEIKENGIKKDGFIFDSRLEKANEILKKYIGKDILVKKPATITDSFIVAAYFSMIGPDFLDKMATARLFNELYFDNSFYYTKDLNLFKYNIIKFAKDKNIPKDETIILANNLVSVWNSQVTPYNKGCISFIKREHLDKNSLIDFEQIVKGLDDISLSDAISMVMESRYTSFTLENDIDNDLIETIEIPSYCNLIEKSPLNMEILEEDDYNSISVQRKNSYGFATIVMFLGLILVSLGIVTFIISIIGR